MDITGIIYQDAANYLGVSKDVLQHAVSRGVFTRLPRKSRQRYLIAEQVYLFKDKRLTLASLSDQEKDIWYQASIAATGQSLTPDTEAFIKRMEDKLKDPKVADRLFNVLWNGLTDAAKRASPLA